MATKRLGKGLSAIIRTGNEKNTLKSGVSSIPISLIMTNPDQPRKQFDQDLLNELAQSINEKGVITPITVRPKKGKFVLIAGERRFRSSKLAGKKNIPAYVIEVTSESEMMEIALIENIQRENLNSIEESEAYALLQGKFDLSPEKIAKTVGKNRSTIINALRLLQLPAEVKKSLRDKKITAGHGRAILSMNSKGGMIKLWKFVLKDKLSVRQAEQFSKNRNTLSIKKKVKNKKENIEIRKIEEELISIFGTKVSINHKGHIGGSIAINYFSIDDLERILEMIRDSE